MADHALTPSRRGRYRSEEDRLEVRTEGPVAVGRKRRSDFVAFPGMTLPLECSRLLSTAAWFSVPMIACTAERVVATSGTGNGAALAAASKEKRYGPVRRRAGTGDSGGGARPLPGMNHDSDVAAAAKVMAEGDQILGGEGYER